MRQTGLARPPLSLNFYPAVNQAERPLGSYALMPRRGQPPVDFSDRTGHRYPSFKARPASDGRTRIRSEKPLDYAIYTLNADGIVTNWTLGAQRFKGFARDEVTAEGVEREDQRKRLRELGCESAQGYLFGRPMSEARVMQLLNGQSHNGLARWPSRANAEPTAEEIVALRA